MQDNNTNQKKRSLGLRGRMLLFFGLLFVLVMTALQLVQFYGLGFMNFEGIISDQRAEVFRDLSLVADLQKEKLLSWSAERYVDAHIIAESPAVRANTCQLVNEIKPYLTKNDTTALAEMLHTHKSFQILRDTLTGIQSARKVYEAIYIADAATGLILVSTDENRLGANISDQDFFIKPLQRGGHYVGNIELDRPNGKPIFRTSHSIKQYDSRPGTGNGPQAEAVLVLEVDADSIIAPMLRAGKGLGKTGEALLVDRNARIITSLKHTLADGTVAEPLEYTITSRPARLAAGGEEGIIESTDYRGVDVLAAFRYLPITTEVGWGMVVKRDRADAFAHLYRNIYYSVLIAVIGIIVLIILATIIAESLSAPIRALNTAASRVSEGDLNARAIVQGSDEVSELAGVFNSMVEQIRNWHTELEEQVRAKTSKLKESEERYKQFVEGTENFITRVDAEGKFSFVNQTSETVFGLSPRECIGLSAFDFTHPDDRETTMKAFAGWLQDKTENVTIENRQVSRSGQTRHMLWTCTLEYNQDGQFVCINSIARDITERKQAEDALELERYRLAKAQEIGSIGTWQLDIVENVLLWTKENHNIFDIPLGTDLTFETFMECVHPDDRDYVHTKWTAAVAGQPYDFEHRIIANGKVKWVREKAELFFDDNRKAVRAIGVTQDITNRKLAETQLAEAKEKAEAANIAKSQFLANMSHEIRTPMNIIMGFADLLNTEELNQEQAEHVGLIRKAVRSLLTVINDILDVSRIEAGKLTIKEADYFLKDVLDGIATVMRPLAKEKGLQFEVFCDDTLPEVIKSDYDRVQQCLVNLIGNAIKFTDTGHIHLKVRLQDQADDHMLRFDVEDTGIGIAQDKYESIFDSFTQGDGSHTRKYGGTGLGLTIARQIARLLGGDLTFSSELGKGSVFSLLIPAAPAAAPARPATPAAPIHAKESTPDSKTAQPVELSGKVLVAEDSEGSQILTRKMLKRIGLEADIAADGKEALEKATKTTYDLILMDMQMPVYNGYEATQQLRKEGVTTPIIALTAYAMEGDREKCIDAGCDDYLSKPFEQKDLTRIINKHLATGPGTA